MRKYFLRCSLLVAASLGAGCIASTGMTSMPSPEIAGRSFRSILVVAEIEDLGLKLRMEDRVAEGMVQPGIHERLPGVRFVPGYTVFFPGREYTGDEVLALLRQNEIDATLVFTPGEAGSNNYYIPPTYTTRCSAYTATGGCSSVSTTQSGALSYSKPWQQFSARVFNASNGRLDWIATATSGGNAFARTADLVVSMADETLERLYADKVVRPDCSLRPTSTPNSAQGGDVPSEPPQAQNPPPSEASTIAAMRRRFALVSDSLDRLKRVARADSTNPTFARLSREQRELNDAYTQRMAPAERQRAGIREAEDRQRAIIRQNEELTRQLAAYCR